MVVQLLLQFFMMGSPLNFDGRKTLGFSLCFDLELLVDSLKLNNGTNPSILFLLLPSSSYNIDRISLCCNCTCWDGFKCYWTVCFKACSLLGASMVLNCCKYVDNRDESQSHAELCWVLSSMIWQQFSLFCFLFSC